MAIFIRREITMRPSSVPTVNDGTSNLNISTTERGKGKGERRHHGEQRPPFFSEKDPLWNNVGNVMTSCRTLTDPFYVCATYQHTGFVDKLQPIVAFDTLVQAHRLHWRWQQQSNSWSKTQKRRHKVPFVKSSLRRAPSFGESGAAHNGSSLLYPDRYNSTSTSRRQTS